MVWVLVWVVLVLGAAAVLFLIGRNLWRKIKALTRELGEVTDRLEAIGAASDRISAPAVSPHDTRWQPPAVRSQAPADT